MAGRASHADRKRIRSCVVMSSLLAWVIVQIPRAAEACAVCSAGRDEENAAAFLISTIFMSLLPLIAIGSIVYGLWRRIQKFESEKEARRDERAKRVKPSSSSSSPSPSPASASAAAGSV